MRETITLEKVDEALDDYINIPTEENKKNGSNH